MAKSKQWHDIKEKILCANEADNNEERVFTAKPIAVFYPNGEALGSEKAYDIRFDVSHSTLTQEQEDIITQFETISCFAWQLVDFSKFFKKNGFGIDIN